jgi:hypothetical protein
MTRTELAAVWPPTASAAREAGHKSQSPLQAIREKCRDCSCYQLNEIRACEAVNCPLWPFRAGKHPWWGEGEKTGQTLADSDRQTAFQGEGSAPGSAPDAERIHDADAALAEAPAPLAFGRCR